ncbi:MAG: hypothetical protein KGM42_00160 [Hyphomicrobiales bacterium]|nr:hypothetical protein [Hyphomicrobiales bacterium]
MTGSGITLQAKRGNVFCKPLGFYFPQVFKLVRRPESRAVQLDAKASGPHAAAPISNYALSIVPPTEEGLVSAVPVEALSPSEERSLIVHHFWSIDHAMFYAKAAEDHLRGQPANAVYENDDGIFTITKCLTHESWPGPTIFYIADSFEDDTGPGLGYWEKWVGCDGKLRSHEIFYETD